MADGAGARTSSYELRRILKSLYEERAILMRCSCRRSSYIPISMAEGAIDQFRALHAQCSPGPALEVM